MLRGKGNSVGGMRIERLRQQTGCPTNDNLSCATLPIADQLNKRMGKIRRIAPA